MTARRLIIGFHAVSALLRRRPEDLVRLYYDAGRLDARMRRLLETAADLPVTAVDAKRLDQMAGRSPHQGVVAETVSRPQPSLSDAIQALDVSASPIVMLLDSITDPHNLGACFRVADAFGVSMIIAPKDRSASITPTVVKAASGATETVPFVSVTNLVRAIEQLKKAGFWIFGADADDDAVSLTQTDLTGPIAWVFGSEGNGIRPLVRKQCDHLAVIPTLGSVESLNISVAAGICLFETRRQKMLKT